MRTLDIGSFLEAEEVSKILEQWNEDFDSRYVPIDDEKAKYMCNIMDMPKFNGIGEQELIESAEFALEYK